MQIAPDIMILAPLILFLVIILIVVQEFKKHSSENKNK